MDAGVRESPAAQQRQLKNQDVSQRMEDRGLTELGPLQLSRLESLLGTYWHFPPLPELSLSPDACFELSLVLWERLTPGPVPGT